MAHKFSALRIGFLLESKAGRYLAYAAAEVVLVIVGILIALQVNNWNVDRVEQRRVRELAHALITDLEDDISNLEWILLQMTMTLKSVDAMGDYTRGKTLDQIDNLDLWFLTATMGYRPYNWNRATIEVLKSTGALQNIRNPEVVTLITRYEAFTHHLDTDQQFDVQNLATTRAAAAELVDLNYPASEEADSVMRNMIRGTYEFPSTALHEIFKGHELQLLTDDMNRIRILTNVARGVGELGARVGWEVPQAISMARKLVDLLKAEYPE